MHGVSGVSQRLFYRTEHEMKAKRDGDEENDVAGRIYDHSQPDAAIHRHMQAAGALDKGPSSDDEETGATALCLTVHGKPLSTSGAQGS